ncbi:hypothetical protein HanIR_Chr15g0768321 [Helianthus annuus]|nr:hypothetical protein HanIR_Chr15g0768321 [Helianthus annuus]
MSHFGRAGPPDITDTYSLLVLNITFRQLLMICFPFFISTERLLMYSSPEIAGLEILGGLLLLGISMQMRLRRQWTSLTVLHVLGWLSPRASTIVSQARTTITVEQLSYFI